MHQQPRMSTVLFFCLITAICLSLCACGKLTHEVQAADKKPTTSTEKKNAAKQDTAGLEDFFAGEQDFSNCTACHTECSDSMHCRTMKENWQTTDCKSCHGEYQHKNW